jgi:hypothetical protein
VLELGPQCGGGVAGASGSLSGPSEGNAGVLQEALLREFYESLSLTLESLSGFLFGDVITMCSCHRHPPGCDTAKRPLTRTECSRYHVLEPPEL